MPGKLEMPNKLSDIPEGVLFSNRVCGFACRTCFSKPISHNYPPVSIPISKEKHPILLKLGAFYHNLLKVHPIHVIWAPSSLMKTYQISRNSTWKGRHIYVYQVNVRIPQVWRTQWNGWRRVAERKRRRNLGEWKRKEWTFEFDRHSIWSWWTDL